MYLSDYYYAKDATGLTKCHGTTNCFSWMTNIINGGFMINRSEKTAKGTYRVYAYSISGGTSGADINLEGLIHPVFYLEPSVIYTGIGDGSKIAPFKIA